MVPPSTLTALPGLRQKGNGEGRPFPTRSRCRRAPPHRNQNHHENRAHQQRRNPANDAHPEWRLTHGEGTALGNLGLALREARRFDEAITACQDAAAIYRDTGDRHGEGLALEGLGLALDEAGRSREAVTACQDAIAIYRQTGDQYREGITRENLDRARAAQLP